MANDATSRSTSNSDSTENTSLSNADQQKVPPLRIVLNSAGNQKSSSAATTGNQQSSTKKAQDVRQEGTLKTGGRVRIKLGTNRQSGKAGTNSETNDTSRFESQRTKDKTNDKQLENINEDSTSSFNHLRRITRRSQRTAQSITNEDEESISSMTSIDENLNTTNSTQPNSDTAHDPDQSNPASTATASSAAANNATNGSSNTDTPRRYKRKKVESSESQSIECDTLLGTQNYRLPNQNSFELFKNIRKQVDKKLKSLTCVHPKAPYGFRDYMLSRGAYLLDGNKLGNGTNLFMNEHGGLNPAPVGKYHVIRQNRISYSVPNRAKVPLGLPVNSPLYDLFIEQEKERYRMRIQHIKEREKLTLAAEQEFMRVYNQAALAAANQTETFSVCTMLKHQEMYNYLDSDGTTILSREDAQQDRTDQPDGVRTRRRQHGQISPAPARKSSNTEESGSAIDTTRKESDNPTLGSEEKKSDQSKPTDETEDNRNLERTFDIGQNRELHVTPPPTIGSTTEKTDNISTNSNPEGIGPSRLETSNSTSKVSEDSSSKKEKSESDEKAETKIECPSSESKTNDQIEKPTIGGSSQLEQGHPDIQRASERLKDSTSDETEEAATLSSVADKSSENAVKVTDEEKKAINKEKFLVHLQEIDDKWDRIRHEMLIRHKNEAESLHAIQKLEWEWKTKEIGACDVRTTLLIDNTLVPKLDIFSQDY